MKSDKRKTTANSRICAIGADESSVSSFGSLLSFYGLDIINLTLEYNFGITSLLGSRRRGRRIDEVPNSTNA
jgi:hypothetical protein